MANTFFNRLRLADTGHEFKAHNSEQQVKRKISAKNIRGKCYLADSNQMHKKRKDRVYPFSWLVVLINADWLLQ